MSFACKKIRFKSSYLSGESLLSAIMGTVLIVVDFIT